jgi:hypothetical protein
MPRSRPVDLRWNALLNDFRRSGLTQAEFCRRRQISLHTFRKRRYGSRQSEPADLSLSRTLRATYADHAYSNLSVQGVIDGACATDD